MACVMVDCGHSRMAKYSHQNASGQRSLDPRPIGWIAVRPQLGVVGLERGMVVGVLVIPACANRSLRYQKPTTCRS